MRTFFWFAIALVLSQVVGQMVAIPLAIQFRTREEFIAVMFALVLFAALNIAVLSFAFVMSDRATSIDMAAFVVAAVTVGLVAALIGYAVIVAGVQSLTIYDIHLAIEFLAPALVIVLIQWWLVRRCKLRVGPTGAM